MFKNNNKNTIYRNHSFGRLRRKVKNPINNCENLRKDYNNNNERNNNDFEEINDYNSTKIVNNYNTIECNNPLHSKYNNIYTSYRNKTKNNNENDYNIEIGNNTKKKINPIIRPSKSAIYNKEFKTEKLYDDCDNKEDDYFLCQNCINERLIEDKKNQKDMLSKNDNITAIFEDKNRLYNAKLIKDKVNQREKNIMDAYHNLEKCQELNSKDKLIKENENAQNPLYQTNHNYLYENFRTKYAKQQKYIKDNINKYQNKERTAITKYFSNYINNPNYHPKQYGEYKPKNFDIENYKKYLSEQINYKINKKRKEKEEDIINEDREYMAAIKEIEKEKEEKILKKQRIKDELIKGNLDLINAKKDKKNKILKEEMKYKEYYEKENDEYNNNLMSEKSRRNKINQDFISENQKNLNRIKRDKEQQKFEKNNYRYIDYSYEPPKEIKDICHKCQKVYPKKLLTKKSVVFGYKKK